MTFAGAPDGSLPVIHLSLDPVAVMVLMLYTDPDRLLSQAIESSLLLAPDITVWLDLQDTGIPHFVRHALGNLRGCGAGIVVTQTNAAGKVIGCSHPPGPPLPQEVMRPLFEASGRGEVWHPIAQIATDGLRNDSNQIGAAPAQGGTENSGSTK